MRVEGLKPTPHFPYRGPVTGGVDIEMVQLKFLFSDLCREARTTIEMVFMPLVHRKNSKTICLRFYPELSQFAKNTEQDEDPDCNSK